MPGRNTVLIVSYHFAPSAAVGARRFSFLAQEFERMGYDVQVIAAAPRAGIHGRGAEDHSLPSVSQVHRCNETLHLPIEGDGLWARVGNAFWRRALAPVGWEYFWSGYATQKAMKQRLQGQGVVIATLPPAAAGIAGARIARRLGWPLILDYRDPWSAYPWPSARKSRLAQWLAHRLESRCVRGSSARVFNTPAMGDWFEKFFPTAAPERNVVIPNGFVGAGVAPVLADDAPLKIVHAGSIYTRRSLVPVLKAAARLSQRNARGVRVVTYGELPSSEQAQIRAAGLEAFLDVHPRMPWDSLLGHLQRAHVLLVLSGDDVSYAIPNKTYDYLAAGRPILALTAPDSTLRRFIDETGAGRSADPHDNAGIEQALVELLSAPASAINNPALERYRWSNLARRYQAVIEATLGAGAVLPQAWQLQS